jgi:hypothetical protein
MTGIVKTCKYLIYPGDHCRDIQDGDFIISQTEYGSASHRMNHHGHLLTSLATVVESLYLKRDELDAYQVVRADGFLAYDHMTYEHSGPLMMTLLVVGRSGTKEMFIWELKETRQSPSLSPLAGKSGI